MALSNWLTRNEWSASYIVGIWLHRTGQLDAPSASEILRGASGPEGIRQFGTLEIGSPIVRGVPWP